MQHIPRGCPPVHRRRRAGAKVLMALGVVVGVLAIPVAGASAAPVPGATYASGVTFPFNGVWLDSADGGHFWDASGNGICRIDADAAAPSGFSENAATCDVQAKKPTQAVVDTNTMSTTSNYSIYSADMSSKSGGPLRLTFDPTADSGAGRIVAASAQNLGGLNTVGFFARPSMWGSSARR
jgi:hypothetical protein